MKEIAHIITGAMLVITVFLLTVVPSIVEVEPVTTEDILMMILLILTIGFLFLGTKNDNR